MSAVTTLHSRTDTDVAGRLALSARHTDQGRDMNTADFPAWLEGRRRAHRFRVDRIPFAELNGWYFESATGNLVHQSGRFFSVEGLRVSVDTGPVCDWQQPIIKQPEVGILGILAKEFDGVLHFLMQAKMEPGNPNLLQLSPTVQATRSNYTKVHKGADVKYLSHFIRPEQGRAVADVLQSEHGSWFYRKSNRNMVVETAGEVPVDPDYCWLTLGQIGELLRRDHVVNMDARTALACMPTQDGTPKALQSDVDLLSWFTSERARHEVSVARIPLDEVADWTRGEHAIERADGRYFRVVAVEVEAGNREVPGWTQPLFEPTGTGVTAFVARRICGIPHLLVHARVEGGFLDTVELGPTVQATPDNWTRLPKHRQPRFLDLVQGAGPDRIRYDALHSEEGGRFLNAVSRYLVVEADESQAPLDPPPGYRWVTPSQLSSLTRHGHYVNVQARTLLAALNSGAADL
ncbi:NDP-hexose 2,3-dehydratase family protein [Streptomyces sp. ST2-7A]|uniref:NDP-hexose 2,3-dehydratase family protein n=1 Tax=Streptomyces sp. ST2-7A TaxID=2907214 RepID=UPI001F27EAD1|nr:NDP-hexose 2,3-dehydratase family protein [Streptomyces sp. ST2-7A]MCE7082466.1 NDP-hexose 2,3-dehydratase family protein [Streptomyces sp. ST2-7A]